MTTPITQYRISHTLTGSIVPLPYDWKIDAATELLVTLVNTSVTPNVETTLVNGTDYSVSGVGSDSGGNVTTTTAYTAGWKIVITNNVPYNQAVDFTNQNSVRPEVVEQMGDNLSKQIKQIVEALTRCVKTTIGSGSSSEDLVDDLYANTAAAAASASNAATSASNAATSETSANNWAIAAQNAATGINWTKARAASTANINIASPGGTIDGVALSALDRVLLKDQTTAAQNGIYVWNGVAVAMTRAADMDTWQEVVSKVVVIEEGTLNADIPYITTVNSGGTLGTTAIPFIVFQPPLQDGAVSTYAKIASGVFASLSEAFAGTSSKIINAATLATFNQSILWVREEQASGTAGGTFTSGAWRTRTLNTVKQNGISGASLASNQITLPAGTYTIEAILPTLNTNSSQGRLQNITDTSTSIIGQSGVTGITSGGFVFVRGIFTVPSSTTKAFEIQHQCTTTRATDGFGFPSSLGTEVYTEVVIKKIG